MDNYSKAPDLNPNVVPPKTWLVESILVTIFCCQILGIISIIYAAGVESKFYKGDIAGAESASNTAKTLVLVSVGLGLVTVVVVGILFATGMLAGFMNN
mgnify:CR=1 FL=1